MNRQLNPNLVSAVLAGVTVLILVVLPFYLEAESNEAKTAEKAGNSSFIDVDRADASVVKFTLRTQIGGAPAMAFVGVGGEIDGMSNPDLTVTRGDIVQITVINGDPMLHDFTIDAFNVYSGELIEDGQTTTVEFVANQVGSFPYYCSVEGHRNAGMEGLLEVREPNDDENTERH